MQATLIRTLGLGAVVVAVGAAAMALGPSLKPILTNPTYEHDKFATLPRDIYREMGAYAVSFDSGDDNDGDGTGDSWAIPEWVAYEIKMFDTSDGELGASPDGPGTWITDADLFTQGIMPHDDSYKFSREWREANPDHPMAGFDRGHMCMKQIAWRMGANADWNSHFLMNACPQKADLNQAIWQDLEYKTQNWADEFGSVWVICGPVLFDRKPRLWLGEPGEVPVAIPDAFFKIVIKEADNGGIDVLAFIYPQTGIDYRVKLPKKYNHLPYLSSVDEIEAVTSLDFLTSLDDETENKIESMTQTALWE